MRDSRAASWLNMGAAAARAGDLDDARFYLERALISDPGLDEQTQIWYWQSRVTSDPAEKRRLLENVIISQPGHAEARRDLAILEGRLKPEDLVDPRDTVGPRGPQAVTGRRYVCPQCGGRLAFDAEKSALACGYCGFQTVDYHAPGGDDEVQEHEFLTALPTVRGHTWELPAARRLACQGCGAGFTLPPGRTTAACPFCHSPHVAESAGADDLIAPEAILPFSVDADEARRRLVRWLRGEDGGPSGLRGGAAPGHIEPVYMPYWVFCIMGEITWQGVLEAPYENETRPVSGVQPLLSDDVLVAASHRLPQGVLSGPEEWDLRALEPYSPDLLADWPVEIYQIPLADASLAARQQARAGAARAIRASFSPGQNVHGLSYDSSGVVVSSYKLILLPAWIASYRVGGRVNGKDYPVAVNGQSGRVHGQVPRQGLRGLLAGMLSG